MSETILRNSVQVGNRDQTENKVQVDNWTQLDNEVKVEIRTYS